MDSGKRDDLRSGEELLAAVHEGEVQTIAQRFGQQLDALMRDHLREREALRQRSVRELVSIVATFERECAASRARFEIERERLRQCGGAAMVPVAKA